MWSIFSRDPLKDFGYEIGEELELSSSIWKLHGAKKKSTGEIVSVFVHEAKSDAENLFVLAKAAVKRFKTLRHPSVLKYVDSLEAEKCVYLVTESVQPLNSFLRDCGYTESQKTFAISWGLRQIAVGLEFLISDCNLAHNSVRTDSVFVNSGGEWQLGGLEYVSNVNEAGPSLPCALEKYIPPEKSNQSGRRHKWSGDTWGLGCLIWEVFNGPLSNPSALKSLGKIPNSLAPHYCELVAADPSKRPSPQEFVSKCRSQKGFMRNRFVDALSFLEEIQVKESSEVSTFFSGLSNQLDSFPQDCCKYKILPQLINAFEFGNAGSSILTPLFKLGKSLSDDEYQKKIVPCVVKLFTSKDRSTRAKLLQQMDQFIHHLHSSLVNDQIFPQVAQGFLDTNPTIREQTIKCMLHMASKLNTHNLNEELMKHFSRLQVKDEQGGIRTNTTVCLGKIATFLQPHMRQKVLITAFSRAMRDPFPPARSAAVVALCTTQTFYPLEDGAKKILPLLCCLTVDPEKSVRDQAFKAIKGFLGKLESVSEDPSLKEEIESEVNTTSSSGSSSLAASLAGWAMTSLTAKFYRTPSTASKPSGSVEPKPEVENQNAPEELLSEDADFKTSTEDNLNQVDQGWDHEEAWEDFDVGFENPAPKKSYSPPPAMQKQTHSTFKKEVDSTFGLSVGEGKKEKEQWQDAEDWDSWNSSVSSSQTVSNDIKKQQREERKLERERKIQERRAARQNEGGPLKLGARKVQ